MRKLLAYCVGLSMAVTAGCVYQPQSLRALPGEGDSAGADDAAQLEPPCGSPWVYQDTFDAGAPQLFWLRYPDPPTPDAVSSMEEAGELKIAILDGAEAEKYAGYFSRHAVDLIGGAISIAVNAALGEGNDAFFAAIRDPENYVGFRLREGLLHFDTVEAGVGVGDGPSVVFDAREHRYWRLREEAQTIHWETSTELLDHWVPQYSARAPSYVHLVLISLGAGRYADAGGAGFIQFDDLNQGHLAARWCKADTLVDDFTDGVAPEVWWQQKRPVEACDITTDASGMQFLLLAQDSECVVATRAAYDLSLSSVTLAVPGLAGLPQGASFFLRLNAVRPDALMLELRLDPSTNKLYVDATASGAPQPTFEWDYQREEKTWQIVQTAEALEIKLADHASTMRIYSLLVAESLDAMGVSFGVTTDATYVPGSASIVVPGYNVIP